MPRSILPSLWNDDKKSADIFSSLRHEIDRVFDDFTHSDHWPFSSDKNSEGKLTPRLDVSESKKTIEVTAELPGVEEKDIDISLYDDFLTIKGEKKSETKKDGENYRLVERSSGSFERTMRLPCEVNAADVAASFKNGVLKLTLPKSPEAKAKTKKIPIKSQ